MYEYEVDPDNVKEADIVVGLASFNEANNIAHPVKQASIGLTRYFKGKKPVIINCDNNSPDGTREAFLNTNTDVPKIYISTPPHVLGKGYNLENLLRKACALGARAIICVDADLISITPEWIKHLGWPINHGYDYVTPIYARHKYDGTITKNICFPLVYGLLGTYIRQPIGGDFSLSAKLAKHILLQPWHRTTDEYGIDIFMTMNAVTGPFKVCQTGLGAKVHKPSAPKLGPMFLQVVKTAYYMITSNSHRLRNVDHVKRTRKFGEKKLGRAQRLTVDREAVMEKALKGWREHRSMMEKVLSPGTFGEVSRNFGRDTLNIGEDLWLEIVFDTLASFRDCPDKTKLVEALRPLYFARVYSFINRTWRMSTPDAEKLILQQAKLFFRNRKRLLERLRT